MEQKKLKQIIEAAILASGSALKLEQVETLFEGDSEPPSRDELLQAIHGLMEDCAERGIELKEVSSGFRFQARNEFSPWVQRLWEEKPQRYSRALLETLALVAYRQPITRAEIEEVRGVGVSSTIIKTLQEREWVRVVGHRDVPGKPAMYATTKEFLDYFNLKSLDEMPTLAEIRDIDNINAELAFEEVQGVLAQQGEEDAAAALTTAVVGEAATAEAEPTPQPGKAWEMTATPAEGEGEEFLSDEDMKAIDALNLAFRDNLSGRRRAAQEAAEETVESSDDDDAEEILVDEVEDLEADDKEQDKRS